MIQLPKAIFDKLSMPWVKAVESSLTEHDSRMGAVEQQSFNNNGAISDMRAWVGNVISGAQQATTVNVKNNIVNITGRTTAVSSGVAAVFGADGTLGITSSAQRFKQDIAAKTYTLDEIAKIQVITYRAISDVGAMGDAAPVQAGVIAEQMLDAGFPEFVLWDGDQPLTVDYARMVVVSLGGVQQLNTAYAALEARVTKLEDAS